MHRITRLCRTGSGRHRPEPVPQKQRQVQERIPSKHARAALFDRRLVFGPVGLLALVGTLVEIAFVTFTSALPLSLVEHWDVARDAALLGWMLTTFYLSAALSGVATGALGRWIERRFLVAGSMLLTPVPLLADFTLEPGGAPYFLTVALAGALTNAAFPLLVVSAHDLAPYAVGTASGMLMGLLVGAAGLLYVGIGWLQERIGMGAAMGGVTSPDSGGDPVLRGFDEASRWEGHASSESFVTRSSVGEGPPIV